MPNTVKLGDGGPGSPSLTFVTDEEAGLWHDNAHGDVCLDLKEDFVVRDKSQNEMLRLSKGGQDLRLFKTGVVQPAIKFKNDLTALQHATDLPGLEVGLSYTITAFMSPQMAFFRGPAAGRPVVTGTRSDGTALASLLTGLAAFGLIDDQSTA